METESKISHEKYEEKENVTSERKLAHLQICLEHDVQAQKVTTGLEDISFIHHATTDMDIDSIDLTTELFGKKLDVPLIISGMTGGHAFANKLNHFLSEAIAQTQIGMGVGSQRAALEKEDVRESFDIVRKNAPYSLIIGNIGAAQIAQGLTTDQIQNIIDMIEADAIAMHFNPLQEAIQPEGDTNLVNLHENAKKMISSVQIPFIAKEVGSGFSLKDIEILKEIGFEAIDIQGVGGTSWAGVESIRTISSKHKKAGEVFWDWGIPTSLSTIFAARNFSGPIIASGGVRSGLDIAKLIALGADIGGMAIPFLFATQKHSTEAVVQFIQEIEYQIRLVCFLTGCQNIAELKKAPLLVIGKTAEMMKLYGINPSQYFHRK